MRQRCTSISLLLLCSISAQSFCQSSAPTSEAATAAPIGVRLINTRLNRTELVTWKTSKQDVLKHLEALPRPSKNVPGMFEEPLIPSFCSHPTDYPPTQESCSFAGYWFADFGTHRYDMSLSFYRDEFYMVTMDFPANDVTDDFQFIYQTMSTALGKPTTDDLSTVSNLMGAKFGQRISTWDFKDIAVVVQHRSSVVDHGIVMMTWKTIRAQVDQLKNKGGKAPF